MSDSTAGPRTIVLVHGLWMTPRSWEHWKTRYERRGYEVLAPAWPGMEVEVEALNEDPSPIAALDVETIVDFYEELIRGLDAPPIIMGHSFGGTFTQLLVDRGLGAAAVGVAPSTVKGILDLPISTLRATSPVLANPLNRHNAVPLDQKEFHYAFCNTMTREESDAIHARYHVPGASHVLREGAFANLHRHAATKVDFHKTGRAPMLFLAFEHDHIIPPKVARHNAAKYDGEGVVAEFKEFPDRPHFPGAPGWEEVADFALSWATRQAGQAAPAPA